jgi:hypothetical protein
MSKAIIDEVARRLTKEFADKGRLIEGGYAVFEHLVIAKDAPDIQKSEMKLAFMAGAEHLFSSIMATLDPEAEPTMADMHRMNLIQKEIDEWRAKISARVEPAKGHA